MAKEIHYSPFPSSSNLLLDENKIFNIHHCFYFWACTCPYPWALDVGKWHICIYCRLSLSYIWVMTWCCVCQHLSNDMMLCLSTFELWDDVVLTSSLLVSLLLITLTRISNYSKTWLFTMVLSFHTHHIIVSLVLYILILVQKYTKTCETYVGLSRTWTREDGVGWRWLQNCWNYCF